MKRLLSPRFLIGLVALSLVVAACGGGDATATPGPQATPTPQATATSVPPPTTPTQISEMRVAMAKVGISFVPELAGTGSILEREPIYDYFAGTTPEGELDFTAGVVISTEVTADLQTWTAKLRDGIVFHNGDELTSADIKAQWDFLLRPEGLAWQAEGLRKVVDSVDAPDESTVVFRRNKPDLFFDLSFFSPVGTTDFSMVIPKGPLADLGLETLNKNPIGSGPYRVTSVDPGGEINYEALDNHWFYGQPKHAAIQILEVPEETSRIALLKSGRADVIELSLTKGPELRRDGFVIAQKLNAAAGNYYAHQQYMTELPVGSPNPFNDVRVRRAMSIAIDRQALVDTFLGGLGEPSVDWTVGPLDPAFVKHPPPQQDPAAARQLLADAGYPNGFEMEMWIYVRPALSQGPEIMEAIAVWWEDIGIDVIRVPVDFAAYRTPWFDQSFSKPTVGGVGFFNNFRNVSLIAAVVEGRGGASRLSGDPAIGAAGAAWNQATTVEDYVRLGRVYQNLVLEKEIYGTLFVAGETFAVHPDVPGTWNLGVDTGSRRFIRFVAGGGTLD